MKTQMQTKASYYDWLRQDFEMLIEAADLPDLKKHFLRSQWLNQILWMEEKSKKSQNWHYILRLFAIMGGVSVPVLVSIKYRNEVWSFLSWLILVVSLMVALAAAIEEFFHFGERWHHYRRWVEWSKIEGWQFFQLSGPYQQYNSHEDAFPDFAGRLEEQARHELDIYLSEVVRENHKK